MRYNSITGAEMPHHPTGLMTATTAFMNNGEDTWVFTVDGDAAQVLKFNCAGVESTSGSERAITTRQQAREFWATAFRVAACMAKGSAMPATSTIWPEYALVQDEADEPLPFGVR